MEKLKYVGISNIYPIISNFDKMINTDLTKITNNLNTNIIIIEINDLLKNKSFEIKWKNKFSIIILTYYFIRNLTEQKIQSIFDILISNGKLLVDLSIHDYHEVENIITIWKYWGNIMYKSSYLTKYENYFKYKLEKYIIKEAYKYTIKYYDNFYKENLLKPDGRNFIISLPKNTNIDSQKLIFKNINYSNINMVINELFSYNNILENNKLFFKNNKVVKNSNIIKYTNYITSQGNKKNIYYLNIIKK